MTKFLFKLIVISLIQILAFQNCTTRKSELVWERNIYTIGSQSSPRTADLNGDGILDIVMGAGKNETQYSEQGILALDGKTGDILWQQEAPDQVYGSATLYDITGDGISDVFIGGRSPQFKALNGKTGEVLWQYEYEKVKHDSVLQFARYNFNNSILVPDQNNDGLSDLLTVNGGNSLADPNSEKDRFPGVLILFDSKTGKVIAADTIPDGKESYMSPVGYTQPGSEEFYIIFGSGGETISGHLYMATLSDLIRHQLSNAKIIATEIGHGFIAPPSIVDITNDGYYDIVAISHNSTSFAIDGKDQKLLWRQQIKNTESSNSFGVGFFTADDIPDFFTFVSKGEWPNNTGSLQVMLDGKDGNISYMDSIGCTGFSSPVVYDLNQDGRDEAIISINEFNCARGFTEQSLFEIENKLIAIDFRKKSVQTIDQMKSFKNIFSTPWIGDLDKDGFLDIVHCQYYSRSGLLTFLGMNVKRISTPIKIKEVPLWGAYMGSNGDGIFKP
ncbi:MAG: PQQ-binding-like beta-propeller repeat protein [Bacteroidia bacterium]|nr:PQQ-binding-like beta-propeller repeat protein [Bacteroidia bacterium]